MKTIGYALSVLVLTLTANVASGDTRPERPTPVTQCGTIIDHPGIYQVTQDIVCTHAGDKGIVIQNVREVTLNIGPHVIKGVTLPNIGSNGYGIQVSNASHVSINGTGGRIESFDYGIYVDKATSLTIGASIQNKFILKPDGHGITIMSGSDIHLVSIIIPSVRWQGLAVGNVNGLQVSGLWINNTTTFLDSAVWMSGVSNATLSGVIVNSAIKAVQLQDCNQIVIDNLTVNKAIYFALNLHMNDGPITVQNSNLNSAKYGLYLTGHNNNLSIKDTKVAVTEAYWADSAICKQVPYASALPALINTTPASVKDCK